MKKILLILFFATAIFTLSITAQRTTRFGAASAEPDWAKRVVWYQIFPERFRNGDKSNDPSVVDTRGAYPHDTLSPWEVHPWTSDWYELQPYEKQNGKDIWHNLQRRRYGGDLQGIIDELDYLQRMGITALYLNPIFTSPSLHKYDWVNLHHIDPNFGPDPLGDRLTMLSETPDDPKTWQWTKADKLFLRLIREVHRRDMYIIIDGVFNHSGIKSFAFQDIKEKGKDSRFADWYDLESVKPLKYKGWYGVPELPELKEKEEGGLADGPQNYIFACTKRWMDPDDDGNTTDGVDGWRLDVAFCINHVFWQYWNTLVRTINPNAYTTAEIIDTYDKVTPYLEKNEFQGVMNYNFAWTAADFFMSEDLRIKPSELDKLLSQMRNVFGEKLYSLQNLYDSHDTNRMTSQIVNRDQVAFQKWQKYFDISHGRDASYNTRKPSTQEYKQQRLAAIFQMTFVGAPMIYYGDEVGMWGANDPDCRKPMLWNDLTYAPERILPNQQPKPRLDIVEPDMNTYQFYSQVINIRKKYVPLQLGDYQTVVIDDARDLYGFKRSYKGQNMYVLLNNNTRPQGITLDLPPSRYWHDVLNEKTYRSDYADNSPDIPKTESIVFAVPAKSAMILIEEQPTIFRK